MLTAAGASPDCSGKPTALCARTCSEKRADDEGCSAVAASKGLELFDKRTDEAVGGFDAFQLAGFGAVENIVVEARAAIAVNEKRGYAFVGKGGVIAVI